jgi:hypothetical protein
MNKGEEKRFGILFEKTRLLVTALVCGKVKTKISLGVRVKMI